MTLLLRNETFSRWIRVVFTAVLLVGTLLAFTSGVFPNATVHAAAQPHALTDARELETFLDGVFGGQLKQNHIPGATISVVKDGRLFFSKGYGEADVQHHTPVVADTTMFRVGSVSKMFTWTAVMQLAEEGKVDLHADINTYLKTFKIPATYPQPITLANLLTHTAGFEDSGIGIFVPKVNNLEPLGKWLPTHMPARVRPPGIVTSYSNYGATLAGYIVEQVSGMPYDQYIEQQLFQPLNMQHSTFRQPLPANLAHNISQGYTFADGKYRADPFEVVQIAPAGSMSTTATDMANYMIAQLQYGRLGNTRILQEKTAQDMQQEHFSNDPHLLGLDYGFYNDQINNLRVIEHGGDTVLFHSLMALLVPQHVGLFVSFNSAAGSSVRNIILRAFMDRYFPAPDVQLEQPPLPGYADRVSQITGSYWGTRRNDTTYQKLGNLLGTFTVSDAGKGHITLNTGGSTQDLVEIQPWVFRDTVIGQGIVAFHKDSRGTSMNISSVPIEGLEKIEWYQTTNFQYPLLLVCALLFLSTLLRWPLRLLQAIRSRSRDKATGTLISSLAQWLGWIVSALFVIFLIGVVVVTLASQNDPFSIPPGLNVLVVLALIAAVLTAAMIVFVILIWGTRPWRLSQRIYYTLLTLAAIAFVIDLAYWNLLKLPA